MAHPLQLVAIVAACYAIGGVPTAYVLGIRLRGVDIRTVGSRNVGALNAFRQLGWRIGLAVLAFDSAKGIVAILVGRALGVGDWGLFAIGMAVAIGNNWSPYLRFAGGKGVAAIFGMSLAMLPLLTLIAIGVVLVGLAATRNVIWAFIFGFAALNGMVVLSGQPAPTVTMCLVLSGIVFVTHFGRGLPEVRAAIADRDFRRLLRFE